MNNDLPPLTHFIQGLSDVFHLHIGSDAKPNEIKNLQSHHFPTGSTIVLSGPPGAGKTTFALAYVRSMLLGQTYAEEPEKLSDRTPKHVVYYISTEVTRERLRRMFGSRGWFEEGDELFKSNPSNDRPSGFNVIIPPPEMERPVKSSEELVNHIVRQISIQPVPRERQFVFIIIDTITSLFKDCGSPGDSRRMTSRLVLLLLLCLISISCSTSSFHGTVPQGGGGTRGKVMIPREDYDEFTPDLAQTLIRHGFQPVTSGDARYTVDLYIGGGFGITSEIIMKDAGVPVITAKASNPGMGTWLIRGPVKRGLFNASLKQFESQLSKLP